MNRSDSLLLIIDVQENLTSAVENTREVIHTCTNLVSVAKRLGVPFIITEQYPKGLGRTIIDIRNMAEIKDEDYPAKVEFSAAKNEKILNLIKKSKKKQIVLAGIETHICVLQTARDLKEMGFNVFVVADGCSSRDVAENILGLQRIMHKGIEIVTFEMVLFEWLGKAGTEEFKELSKLIK